MARVEEASNAPAAADRRRRVLIAMFLSTLFPFGRNNGVGATTFRNCDWVEITISYGA